MATLKSLIAQLENLSKALANDAEIANTIGLVAAKEFEAAYKTRLFVRGMDSKNRKIGSYSRAPFYVNPQSKSLVGLPKSKFSPMGKNGKSKFKNGKKKKTRFLKAGYSEFRQRAGRQNKTVDLNLSGSLFNSMQIGIKGSVIHFGFTDAQNIKKAQGNEQHFRRVIFAPTQEEREIFREAAIIGIQKTIKDIIK
jgi:hypothetical protein